MFLGENVMNKRILSGLLLLSMCCLVGCAPKSFVRQSAGWKTIELNSATSGVYSEAWQKTVDTIAKSYDIEMMDRDSGYLRTCWTYGISGGGFNRYRGRITIKYPEVETPEKIEIKTEAQWLDNVSTGLWLPGYDSIFQRDVYTALSGRLGRTVATD